MGVGVGMGMVGMVVGGLTYYQGKKVIVSSRGLIIPSGKENQILPKHIKKSMGERRTIHFEFIVTSTDILLLFVLSVTKW